MKYAILTIPSGIMSGLAICLLIAAYLNSESSNGGFFPLITSEGIWILSLIVGVVHGLSIGFLLGIFRIKTYPAGIVTGMIVAVGMSVLLFIWSVWASNTSFGDTFFSNYEVLFNLIGSFLFVWGLIGIPSVVIAVITIRITSILDSISVGQ